ncbi:arsenic-transporting ATPase [Nocardioides szechwanensis]|uniref:arsenite-transporting ATPase n=1 Tax=Nocardioides szechwanensis TaxID=1005944 RepID=A0A1G9VAR6_9ACTN|nr:ArsA family ATPase [Nocardioides szechwanensis]GEP32984.1 arsenic-transporting ATPase [Nocardioides szechwanensis]SDM69147.1 arsenite efflux ATP-binding protein ArsA [Nocardioides szechwanensis]
MRILLFTGKGGVGKSTVAAGTAALAASQGLKTLVLSTDAAHSLADAFGAVVGSDPTEVADGLFVQQVDAQLRFEQSWAEIQGYLLSVLDVAGVDRVAAEELTVIPGAEEVLALLELRLHAVSGTWDVIVVDCAPTAETLRLLALPEALGWYMERVLPMERRVIKALKPVLTRAAGVPMPGDSVFDAIERLHAELDQVHALLAGPDASVRLVLTPETVVLAEARRSYTSLSLFGYRVDGVVANRIFPADDADDWRAGWVMAQDAVLAQVDQSFAGLPIWRSEYRAHEPVGVAALTTLAAEVYAGSDPLAAPTGHGPYGVDRTTDGAVLRLSLPFVTRAEVGLARNGDELVVTVGSYRRLLTLPAGLARLRVAGARVEAGELRVRFTDPAEEKAREKVT